MLGQLAYEYLLFRNDPLVKRVFRCYTGPWVLVPRDEFSVSTECLERAMIRYPNHAVLPTRWTDEDLLVDDETKKTKSGRTVMYSEASTQGDWAVKHGMLETLPAWDMIMKQNGFVATVFGGGRRRSRFFFQRRKAEAFSDEIAQDPTCVEVSMAHATSDDWMLRFIVIKKLVMFAEQEFKERLASFAAAPPPNLWVPPDLFNN